jgi:hypothetical protein
MRGVALALVLLLLLPSAGAHWYVRHADNAVPRTRDGDHFALASGPAHWRVLAPDGSLHEAEGDRIVVPPGLPADGTWVVRVEPLACNFAPDRLSWHVAWRTHALDAPFCGALLYAFNWQPAWPFGDGTILALGPNMARFDLREAQEPTVYQGATPYYSVDNEDAWSPDYEVLAGNSFAVSDTSRPDSDDDGDGVPNRADPDHWATAWLHAWAGPRGIPLALPAAPRAELLAEDHLREVARTRPDLHPWLGEDVGYATSSTAGEPPHATPLGSTEVLTFAVPNDRSSAAIHALRALGVPQVVHRRVHDVLLHVPPSFTVDAAASRALLPPGWALAHWTTPDGERASFQGDAFHGIGTGETLDLRLVARATQLGPATWDATLLAGPAAPERRYAFLAAEVVR